MTGTIRTDGDPLGDLPLLAALPAAVRADLAAGADVLDLAGGDWLFQAGDASDGMYLVRTGRLEVVRDGSVVREVGQGGMVGELSLLTGAVRAASVRARRDSRLLRLAPDRFEALVAGEPALLRQVAATVAGWVQTGRPATGDGRATGLVTVTGAVPGVPVDAVAAALASGLAGYLRVATPGRVTPAELERAELASDRVVLVAGAQDGPWREFCRRQCDRVVLVADGAAPPPAGTVPDPDRHADLVLVGPPPGRERLVRWCDAVAPRRVYRIGADPAAWAAGLAPLARRIAGRSIGLVLAGGGARAICHIGVVEELAAAGIVVDRVAGTSLGAVIAAAFAAGMDAEQMHRHCVAEFVRRNPLNDYTLPRVALSRGGKARAALTRLYGDLVIEELEREFACVSVDLHRQAAVTHRRGPVVDAVRASMSLPVIFPPYRIGGSLHVDGALLDNLPVSALAGPEGPVIAVSIATGGGRPHATRLPPLPETLQRSILMAAAPASAAAEAAADLVIRPDLRGVGLLAFRELDRVRSAGATAARAALEACPPDIRRSLAGPAR